MYIHGISFYLKKEGDLATCDNMDEGKKENKLDTEKQLFHDLTYMCNLELSNSREAESKIMVAKTWWEGGCGKILVKEHKISVIQDK